MSHVIKHNHTSLYKNKWYVIHRKHIPVCILCISDDEYSMHCVLDLYTSLELIIGIAYIHNNIGWNTGNDILHVHVIHI